VDEYFKEMEIAMIRANVIKDREATMARFLNGQNRDIANVVELQHCVELEDMVHMATKVERQIKRRGSTHFQTNSASSSSTWRPNLKREGVVQPNLYAKAEPPKAKKDTHTDEKGKSESQPARDRDIKCFKCLGTGILHLSVQTEELCLQEIMGRLNLKVKNLKVKRCHLWWIVVMRRLHILLRGRPWL